MTDDETRSGVFRNDRLRVAANTVLFKRQPRTAGPIPNHPVNQSVRAALKMYARVVRADKESIPDRAIPTSGSRRCIAAWNVRRG